MAEATSEQGPGEQGPAERGAGVLAGVTVVEFAQNAPVPHCGRLLAGMGATPNAELRPSPQLGEHTDEVLTQIGCSPDEMAAWRRAGVLSAT